MKPNAERDLLPDNVRQFTEKDIANIRDKYFGKTFIESVMDLTGVNKKDAEAIRNDSWNREVYEINKHRPEFIQKYFTPEQVQRYEQLRKIEDATNATLANDMVERGLLSKQDAESDYVTYAQSKKFLDLLPKEARTFDFLGNGTVTYKTAGEVFNALARAQRIAQNPKNGVSLNPTEVARFQDIYKKKGEGTQLDVTRFHSPVIRLLTQAKRYGEMAKNDDIIRAIETVRNTGDKNVVKRVDEMIGLNGKSNILMDLLGVGQKQNIAKKSAQTAAAGILFANPTPLLQAVTSTGVRGAITLLAKRTGIDPRGMYDAKVQSVLRENGMVGDYD
jgi:hypothetical protein